MQLHSHDEPKSIMSSSIRLFLFIFMLTGALTSALILVFYQSEIKTRLTNLKIQETFSLELQSQFIGDIFDSIVGDLLFISQQNELKEFLSNNTSASLDKIASEYIAIAKQKKTYDQIRFLDSNGLETVRVNFNHGSPSRVSKEKLQKKQNRYYFRNSYDLEKGAVFISPFDLNIENGAIEQPLKPMIRLGTPVFDSKNQKRGIVLINYLGDNLLGKILESEPISEGQTMLLNSEGYWLLSPTLGQAWGFMFKDEQRTFGNLYKEAWEEIRLKNNGQIKTANGLFTFKTIYPLKEGYFSSTGSGKSSGKSKTVSGLDLYKWHLVSFTPSHIINSYSDHLQTKLFLFGAGMFLIVATGSWIIALSVTKSQRYQAQLKVMALFDSLTKLPNRRLFFDRLNMAVGHSRRNKNLFGILYIDLDGFKSVNDSLGHETGDELLCRVAELLNTTCRKSDTVARLGGDEFGIIINQLESAKGAQAVAEKIIAALSSPIQLSSGSVHVGASIGISLFPADSDNAEKLVGLADKSMYESKRQGKNTYTFSGTVPHS